MLYEVFEHRKIFALSMYKLIDGTASNDSAYDIFYSFVNGCLFTFGSLLIRIIENIDTFGFYQRPNAAIYSSF